MLGIDIGGTNIKAGCLHAGSRRVLNFTSHPTPRTAKALNEFLLELVRDYRSRFRIQRIGLGVAGQLDLTSGALLKSGNLPWHNFPLLTWLKHAAKLPVTIDNDANAFTLAEASLGAGRGYTNVIGVTLGTGVGGGIVIQGKLHCGRGNAGELGHLLQSNRWPRGPFNKHDDIEEQLQAAALLSAAKRRGLAVTSVASLAHHQSRAATVIWHRFGSLLSYALASLSHILDPDIIIVGGQIAKAWPRFIRPLRTELKHSCIFLHPPRLARAKLGDQAGVIGAALLTKHYART